MFFGAAKTMEISANNPVSRSIAASPAVSIITPAYKVADLIATTIDSVFAQTFQDFEWIIVNDGSPDTVELEKVLSPIFDRIVYITQTNAGAAVARNTAIEIARGEFLALLDGDDIWFPEYLDSQLSLINHGGYDMVYANAELIGDSAGFGKTFMDQAPSAGEVNVSSLLDLQCNVLTSGTVVRKAAVDHVGRFEDGRVQSEDFHLWVRIARAGFRIGYSAVPRLQYRVSSSGLSGGAEERIRRAIDVFERIEKQIELSTEEKSILARRLKDFEADLAVVTGKRCLLAGDFRKAGEEFDRAKNHRWSPRIAAIAAMTKIAPRIVTNIYKRLNPSDVSLVASR